MFEWQIRMSKGMIVVRATQRFGVPALYLVLFFEKEILARIQHDSQCVVMKHNMYPSPNADFNAFTRILRFADIQHGATCVDEPKWVSICNEAITHLLLSQKCERMWIFEHIIQRTFVLSTKTVPTFCLHWQNSVQYESCDDQFMVSEHETTDRTKIVPNTYTIRT